MPVSLQSHLTPRRWRRNLYYADGTGRPAAFAPRHMLLSRRLLYGESLVVGVVPGFHRAGHLAFAASVFPRSSYFQLPLVLY